MPKLRTSQDEPDDELRAHGRSFQGFVSPRSGPSILRDEREEESEYYVFKERRFGSFERSFTLPANADRDNIQAQFSKGVLTVTVPRKPGAAGKAKKIRISSG